MSNDIRDQDAIEMLENEAPISNTDTPVDDESDGVVAVDESGDSEDLGVEIIDLDIVVSEDVPTPIALEAIEASGVDPDAVIAAFADDDVLIIDIAAVTEDEAKSEPEDDEDDPATEDDD